MKKLFTLFAAALVGFCAFAQDTEPCPTKLGFVPVTAEQDANNVQLELTLMYNNSDNLNAFNIEVSKTGGEWIMLDEITETWLIADGYEANILKAWGKPEATCIANLSKMCDVMSNVKEDGHLVMIETLKTNACRFFPRVEEGEPLPIGKFAIDLSACEDGDYTLNAPGQSALLAFSYTGGEEAHGSWFSDEDVEIVLTKTGDKVTVKGEEPVVEPVTIAGKVVDEDNAPLEGVTVTLDEVTGAKEAITATTAADGTYSLEYTPEEGKEYNVTFAKDGYKTQSYDVENVPETVVLKIASGISTIGVDSNDGRIYDLQGRELKSVPEHGIYIQNGKKYVK